MTGNVYMSVRSRKKCFFSTLDVIIAEFHRFFFKLTAVNLQFSAAHCGPSWKHSKNIVQFCKYFGPNIDL